MKTGKEYFVMINYKTKEKYLCSWFDGEPDFFGQKVHYIGTQGLGGYRNLLRKGFIDRRDNKPIKIISKVQCYIMLKNETVLRVFGEKIDKYQGVK